MSNNQVEEDDYHSSSDEDYDPEKDTEIDPQDEIDDAEEEGEPEDVEETKKDKDAPGPAGNSSGGGEVDVDALFAELTGQAPPPTTSESKKVEEKKPEEKVYPKSTPSSSTTPSSKVYPPQKSETENSTKKPEIGTKRVGLLDAAKSLSKKSKISTLEKSDRDWKKFTTEQNIKEDLESHNRGKGGYLNKMDFLNRADNRQFEKERAFRATARKDNN